MALSQGFEGQERVIEILKRFKEIQFGLGEPSKQYGSHHIEIQNLSQELVGAFHRDKINADDVKKGEPVQAVADYNYLIFILLKCYPKQDELKQKLKQKTDSDYPQLIQLLQQTSKHDGETFARFNRWLARTHDEALAIDFKNSINALRKNASKFPANFVSVSLLSLQLNVLREKSVAGDKRNAEVSAKLLPWLIQLIQTVKPIFFGLTNASQEFKFNLIEHIVGMINDLGSISRLTHQQLDSLSAVRQGLDLYLLANSDLNTRITDEIRLQKEEAQTAPQFEEGTRHEESSSLSTMAKVFQVPGMSQRVDVAENFEAKECFEWKHAIEECLTELDQLKNNEAQHDRIAKLSELIVEKLKSIDEQSVHRGEWVQSLVNQKALLLTALKCYPNQQQLRTDIGKNLLPQLEILMNQGLDGKPQTWKMLYGKEYQRYLDWKNSLAEDVLIKDFAQHDDYIRQAISKPEHFISANLLLIQLKHLLVADKSSDITVLQRKLYQKIVMPLVQFSDTVFFASNGASDADKEAYAARMVDVIEALDNFSSFTAEQVGMLNTEKLVRVLKILPAVYKKIVTNSQPGSDDVSANSKQNTWQRLFPDAEWVLTAQDHAAADMAELNEIEKAVNNHPDEVPSDDKQSFVFNQLQTRVIPLITNFSFYAESDQLDKNLRSELAIQLVEVLQGLHKFSAFRSGVEIQSIQCVEQPLATCLKAEPSLVKEVRAVCDSEGSNVNETASDLNPLFWQAIFPNGLPKEPVTQAVTPGLTSNALTLHNNTGGNKNGLGDVSPIKRKGDDDQSSIRSAESIRSF